MVNLSLLDWLAPGLCLRCQLPSGRALPLCSECESELPANASACPVCALPQPDPDWPCARCQLEPPAFERCLSPWLYQPPIDRFIQRFKYHGDMGMLPLLVHLLCPPVLAELEALGAPDVIVPVPMHWRKRLWRGFNQAETLAESLRRAKGLRPAGLRVDSRLCRKTRHTPAQFGLDLRQRRGNLRGAFECRQSLRGQFVVILDDVVTTGATVNWLAEALREAGAARVHAWCVARAS